MGALNLKRRVIAYPLQQGTLGNYRPEPVLDFFSLSFRNRATNMGKRVELLWTSLCARPFRSLFGHLVCHSVPFDVQVLWYQVSLYRHSSLS